MCGRFAFDAGTDDLERRFNTRVQAIETGRKFNITPGMFMPVIMRPSGGSNTAILAKWGLIPYWAKDPAIGYRMINARAEGIEAKPAFRVPFARQRCLVPTTGFYEWARLGDEKIPYFIRLKDGNLFAFAGLYDRWKDAEGRELTTFTIITTTPNGTVAPIHDRMPVVFSPEDEDRWLDPSFTDTTRLLAMLTPYGGDDLESYRVSPLVNNPDNDMRQLTEPAGSGPAETSPRAG